MVLWGSQGGLKGMPSTAYPSGCFLQDAAAGCCLGGIHRVSSLGLTCILGTRHESSLSDESEGSGGGERPLLQSPQRAGSPSWGGGTPWGFSCFMTEAVYTA